MLRRALPLVLATLVIVPALAQDRIVSSTFRSAGATAQAPGQRAAAAQAPYFPERFDWQHKKPDEVGMNPALVNEAVTLVKDSSLVSAIGLAELALAARTVAGAYSRYWEPYLFISAIYLVITLTLSALARRLEAPVHTRGK